MFVSSHLVEMEVCKSRLSTLFRQKNEMASICRTKTCVTCLAVISSYARSYKITHFIVVNIEWKLMYPSQTEDSDNFDIKNTKKNHRLKI